jgi:hypothetical protein
VIARDASPEEATRGVRRGWERLSRDAKQVAP